jgi:hypothetical protein
MTLKEKAFYVWHYPKERKREARKECQGKTCPLYNDAGYSMHCGSFAAGWCNHNIYGVLYDELLVRLEDAQSFEEKCLEYAKLIAAQAEKYAEDKNELKQKLQQLFDTSDPRWTKYWSPRDKPRKEQTFLWLDYVRDWLAIKEKFEELLKQ